MKNAFNKLIVIIGIVVVLSLIIALITYRLIMIFS